MVSLAPRRCPISRPTAVGSVLELLPLTPRRPESRPDDPRGSDAVRVVPMRGFSFAVTSAPGRPSTCAPGRSRSNRGGRAARMDPGRPPAPILPALLVLLALSASGGGVGGKRLRFNGGSECWRLRLVRFFCTRWLTAKGGLSGCRVSSTDCARWSSLGWGPPYRSDAAISRALPR